MCRLLDLSLCDVMSNQVYIYVPRAQTVLYRGGFGRGTALKIEALDFWANGVLDSEIVLAVV